MKEKEKKAAYIAKKAADKAEMAKRRQAGRQAGQTATWARREGQAAARDREPVIAAG